MYKKISKFKIIILLVSLSAIIACSSIEKRPERVAKRTLPPVDNSFSIKSIWSKSVGKGTCKQVVSLAIAKNSNTLCTTDYMGKITCLDKDSANISFQTDLKTNITAGPVLESNNLFVVTSEGKLLNLSLETGETVWEENLPSEVMSLPLVSNGVIYVHALDSSVTAFNTTTGKQIWQYTSIAPDLILRKSSSPVIYGSNLLIGVASGKILAINKDSGILEWRQEISTAKGRSDLQRMVDVSSSPVVANGNVYAVSYQGNLTGINSSSAEKIFEKPISSHVGVEYDHNVLYVATTDGELYALDSATGKELWQQDYLQGRWLSKPVILSKYILIGDDEGYVHMLDKNDGTLLTRIKIDGSSIESSILIDNNTVYVLSNNGKLSALTINNLGT